MLQTGDIVFIRITGEPAFILAHFIDLEGDEYYRLRRAKNTANGIEYVNENLLVSEIATPEDFIREDLAQKELFYNIRKEFDKRHNATADAVEAAPLDPSQLSLLN